MIPFGRAPRWRSSPAASTNFPFGVLDGILALAVALPVLLFVVLLFQRIYRLARLWVGEDSL